MLDNKFFKNKIFNLRKKNKNFEALELIKENLEFIDIGYSNTFDEVFYVLISTKEILLAEKWCLKYQKDVRNDIDIKMRLVDVYYRSGKKDQCYSILNELSGIKLEDLYVGKIISYYRKLGYKEAAKNLADCYLPLIKNGKDLNNEIVTLLMELKDNNILKDEYRSLSSIINSERLDPDLFLALGIYLNEDTSKLLSSYSSFDKAHIYENLNRKALCTFLSDKIHQRVSNTKETVLLSKFLTNNVIFQYWNDINTMSKDVEYSISRWAKIENSEYVIFDTFKAQLFIEKHFGEQYLLAFDKSIHPAQQADLIRLAYLYVNGGIYVDIDFLPNPNILNCPVYKDAECAFYYRDNLLPQDREVLNSFIVAKPKSKFILNLVQRAFGNLLNDIKKGIWRDTGPGLVTEALLGYASWESVHLLPHNLVFRHCLKHKVDGWSYKSTSSWQDLDFK